MKQAIIMLALLFAASCQKRNNPQALQSTKVVVVTDLTDTFLLAPKPSPILSLFNFSRNKSQEAALDFVMISDKQLNPVQHIHLGDAATSEESNTADDVHYRDKLIKAFCAAVTRACSENPQRFKSQQPLGHSEVFCTIISQLRTLAAGHYQQKVLLVFSDLMENSSVFDAYADAGRAEVQQHPEAVGMRLSQRCGIPGDLRGITIIFVFQPRSRQEDERFIEMVSVYQLMLEKRGAKIFFQASADNFQHNYD